MYDVVVMLLDRVVQPVQAPLLSVIRHCNWYLEQLAAPLQLTAILDAPLYVAVIVVGAVNFAKITK